VSHTVRVTPRAASDLDRALTYLRSESPQAADNFRARFVEILEQLTQFDTSRATRDPRYRILNTHPFPYLIFVRHRGERIDIVAIRHGARNPRSMPARPR
jgi:toxin ParE1/3/4